MGGFERSVYQNMAFFGPIASDIAPLPHPIAGDGETKPPIGYRKPPIGKRMPPIGK